MRLLEWVFKNRPKGESFRNTELEKKDLVSGSIAFDDGGWIIRSKGGKTNQYEIESGILKALRTDVPQEVSKISKIKDVNIQSQHPSEQYFMLTESPGQVAKQFNKVVGLTIMDDALIKINGNVRTTKHKCDSANESIESHEKQIDALAWTKDASTMLDGLTKDELVITLKIRESDNLFAIVEEYKEMQEKYKKLTGLTQARKDLLVLYADYEKMTEKQNISDTLFDCVSDIKNVDLKLTSTVSLKKAVSQIPALFSQEESIDVALDSLQSIQKVVYRINTCNEQLEVLKKEHADLEEEWLSHAGEECPLCQNIL